jgi:hypothetical protein
VENRDLLMDLTQEQGPRRKTQVQPTTDIWALYFKVDLFKRPTLRLECRQRGLQPEQRPVVKHNHVYTIEVTGADVPRPAILRFQRAGTNSYVYWVYQKQDPEYDHCDWMLNTFPNEARGVGRRWLII